MHFFKLHLLSSSNGCNPWVQTVFKHFSHNVQYLWGWKWIGCSAQFLSLSVTHTHTHIHTLLLPLSVTHTLSPSFSHTHSFSLFQSHTHTFSFSLSSAFITSDPFYCISQLISVIKIFLYGVQPAKVKLLWLSGSLALQSKPFNLSFQILARSLCSCL